MLKHMPTEKEIHCDNLLGGLLLTEVRRKINQNKYFPIYKVDNSLDRLPEIGIHPETKRLQYDAEGIFLEDRYIGNYGKRLEKEKTNLT